MIKGIGIDMVKIDRLRAWITDPKLCARFFHPRELTLFRGKKPRNIVSLAARFAAKEAFGKALGTGLKGFSLKEIAVVNDEHGRPHMHLHGKAAAALKSIGGGTIFISLNHEVDYALAMVIIEGGKDAG
jgi:holo-[acyl-carrier protein] synthase